MTRKLREELNSLVAIGVLDKEFSKISKSNFIFHTDLDINKNQ